MKPTVLKDNRDFQRLYHKGKRSVSGLFAVYYRQNGTPDVRIGITAGKKLGCAVKRNRIRRQIREVLRLSSDSLNPGFDIVIVARTRAIGKAWQELQEDLLNLLRSGGLISRTV
ncbi:MAG: ribonuclease P protein component [Ruminococcaceae bacterium]|nr:ribonuclease P protein component [Oscillospiraceae bacterium]MBQ8897376.1 ribonuclease P protein component [Clostridia bacterium]